MTSILKLNIRAITFFTFIFFTLSSCNIKLIDGYAKKSKIDLKLTDQSFTSSDGYEIAYSDNLKKDKPTLFFLHGYFASRWNFFPLAKKINNNDYRIIAVDIPGFGESTRAPDGDYKTTSQSKRLVELIEHLNLENNIHLVSTSLGSSIAIAINGLISKKISSNTLIAPYGIPLYTKELPGLMEYFIKTGKIGFVVDDPYDQKKTNKLMYYANNIPSYLVPGFVKKELRDLLIGLRPSSNKVGRDILYDKNTVKRLAKEHPTYSILAKKLNVNIDSLDVNSDVTIKLFNELNNSNNITKIDSIGDNFESMLPYLDKIDNPVMVVWGKKDNIINYNTVEYMKPHIKNGIYKFYNNGSHGISIFRSKSISKHIKKMISEIKG